ncbi:MAG: mechanosensitive ion channel domain-containing protein [Pirellulales bacterium]
MFTLLADTAPAPTDVIPDSAREAGNALESVFTQMLTQTASLAPKVIAALAVVVLGYLVARVAGKLFVTLAQKVGMEHAAHRVGLVDSMKQVGIKRSVSGIIGTIVFWFLMCVFLMAAVDILNLQPISAALKDVLVYIPLLLRAAVVIIVGLLAATFIRGVVATSADRFGITYAQSLASACYYLLVLMTLLAGFDQLKIQFELLNSAILIVFAGMALAFGLAVGLGGRDVVAGILAGYYLRQRMQSGDWVSVGPLEGTIREVGPVATIIETDEDGLMNRRSVPNSKMLHEAVR